MKILSTKKKGAIGENYAAAYMKKQGLKIIDRNMKNKYGEIDIIAENKEYIVFTEVKSRTNEDYLRPSTAVDMKKQRRIMASATEYLKINIIDKQPRFDVAEVYLSAEKSKPYKINYIENAYIQGGDYAVF